MCELHIEISGPKKLTVSRYGRSKMAKNPLFGVAFDFSCVALRGGVFTNFHKWPSLGMFRALFCIEISYVAEYTLNTLDNILN